MVFLFITGRNEVVAKAMFLQLCVILFTGGGVCQGDPQKEAPPKEGDPPKGRPPCQGDPQEGVPPRGRPPRKEAPPRRRPPKKEAPPPKETPPRRRHPPKKEAPSRRRPPPRRRHPPRRRPPPRKQTQAYGQWAAGTHPTGMHSCLFCFFERTMFQKINSSDLIFPLFFI